MDKENHKSLREILNILITGVGKIKTTTADDRIEEQAIDHTIASIKALLLTEEEILEILNKPTTDLHRVIYNAYKQRLGG